MKILQVLTSHDQLGNKRPKTGFWLEEGAAPYFVFRDADVDLTLASPKGGRPPMDPKSDLPENQTPAMEQFKKDERALKAFANTVKLAEVKAEDFDTVFYTGGHGPMWGLAESPVSIALLKALQLREANCAGLPLSWGTSSCEVQGRAVGKGEACNWLYEWRGRRGKAYARGAIPRGR